MGGERESFRDRKRTLGLHSRTCFGERSYALVGLCDTTLLLRGSDLYLSPHLNQFIDLRSR